MFATHARTIMHAVVLLALLGSGFFVAQKKINAVIIEKERSFNEKLEGLEKQIETLAARVQKIPDAKSQDTLLTEAVARIAPSVVSLVVSKDVPKLEVSYENPFGNDPFFKNFNFRVPVYKQRGTVNQRVGAGTGFVVAADGYILTNRHVVADTAATYTALLADGTQKPAQVVFRDNAEDAALLKIAESNLTAAPLGDSSMLKLGQTVVAIGNALGEYSNSVSIGIISGLNRTLEAGSGANRETLAGVIQTDAAINPGNSGGPLINLQGEVIGVNVATIIGGSGISFSLPINKAKMLVDNAMRR